MNKPYDIEICDHCGVEFEVGYWRNERKLCESCLLVADEAPLEYAGAADDLEFDDWDYSETPLSAGVGMESTLPGY